MEKLKMAKMNKLDYLKLYLMELLVENPEITGSYKKVDEAFWSDALPLVEKVN